MWPKIALNLSKENILKKKFWSCQLLISQISPKIWRWKFWFFAWLIYGQILKLVTSKSKKYFFHQKVLHLGHIQRKYLGYILKRKKVMGNNFLWHTNCQFWVIFDQNRKIRENDEFSEVGNFFWKFNNRNRFNYILEENWRKNFLKLVTSYILRKA